MTKQNSQYISDWLVLGPIFNPAHQTEHHQIGDGHPLAADILKDIDGNTFAPVATTDLDTLGSAPNEGDVTAYGNGKFFASNDYRWRVLSFRNIDWEKLTSVEDNLHASLEGAGETHNPKDPLSFAGKHHALAFMLVYIRAPEERRTPLCVRSDDAIRLWLNGVELGEPLRYEGERDIYDSSWEACADVNLQQGWNVLLAAVAETHVEWGVSVRFANADGLEFSTTHSGGVWMRVYGIVRNEFGEPLDGVTVQAFDRDMRSEQLLGAVLAKTGKYEIRYQRSQFLKAEKDSADLIVKVLDAAGKPLYVTPIQYNVPDEIEVNIVLEDAEFNGTSEYDVLTEMLTPLLDGVSPLEVREDDQFQDVSFLAGETGCSLLTIGTWVACQRLAEKTAIENTPLQAAVFYGFMRQGQPSLLYGSLLDDVKHPDRITLLEDKILRDLSNIIPELQQSLLEKAVADNLVSSRIKPQIPAILETLRQIKLKYAADISFGGGKGTVGQLLGLTPAAKEKQTDFLKAFTEFRGPINEFWKKLETDQILPEETVKDVKLSFELGALTRNHIPLVGELKRMFQQGTVGYKRELAKFSREDWKQIFQRTGSDGEPIGVPANIDGHDDNAKQEQFAANLEQRFERSYPTTMLSAKLARAKASPLTAKADIIHFVENNPQFHLDRHRIDQYLVENKDALNGIANPETAVREIKSVQRVFKLNSTYEVADALLSQNIDSAQQVYFLGREQVVTALADAGINKIEANKIYSKAENAYSLALALFGSYNISLNGVTPYAAPSILGSYNISADGVTPYAAPSILGSYNISAEGITPSAAPSISLDNLPNLQTLFGSVDYCECTECRSVYSPAAYFVDILHFLKLRGTQGTDTKNVMQVLLERRPDLGEIELSCENTNTPLPYIDLVNEVLEDAYLRPTPVILDAEIEKDLKAGKKIEQTVLKELTVKGLPISDEAEVYAPDSQKQWAIRDQQHAYKVFKTGTTLHILPTKQTHLSAAELRANPEYTNIDAYKKLAKEIFPLNLPFDLWSLQTRTYLQHLGVSQPRLFELFQHKPADKITLSPSDLQIDCAWLGITEQEREIITDTLTGKQPWEFWGLKEDYNDIPNPGNPADSTKNVSGGWQKVLSHVNIMLHRSGLTYKELLQLLEMKYINPTGNIVVFDTPDSNAAVSDTSQFRIFNLTKDSLNKIHRFIRLWRKLDCAMWEVDLLLDTSSNPAVIDRQLTDAVLRDISGMSRLRDRFAIDWRTAYSLYHNIDHNLYVDWSSPGAPPVQTLYQRLFRNTLVDAVTTFPESPELIKETPPPGSKKEAEVATFPENPALITGTIAGKFSGIIAAFRIKESDLTLILDDDLKIDVTHDPNTLDLSYLSSIGGGNNAKTNWWFVLSRIYRITLLAKGLGLTVDAFLRLQRLHGQDPFANPAATLAFAKLADKVSNSGFSVPELDYLLAHNYVSSSGVALDDKTITSTLKAIREGLQKIDDDIRLKKEETPEAYVKSKLGLLPTLVKDSDQAKALAIINGTWKGSTADRDKLIDAYFDNVLLNLTEAKAELAAIAAELSPADHQDWVNARFAYVQSALESFLLQAQKEALVLQKTTEVFQLDAPSMNKLLKSLKLPDSAMGKSCPLLQSINDARLLEKQEDGSYMFALETAFKDIYKSFRLLHKNALLIGKLGMKADELAWWLKGTYVADKVWMHPQDFPIDPSTTIPLAQWEHINDFFSWKSTLPKSTLTAFEFIDKVLNNKTAASANIASLAELTAWRESDIKTLVDSFGWNVDVKQEFRKAENLLRLADDMAALRRLGVNAARAIEWANPEPASPQAESLKQTVKSKYDLAQWVQVIQPIQDTFRENKRDALVSWLATHPYQKDGLNWSDADSLYNYFLIDVEMSALMLTSRLKQATASAQLFAQRCLLNLEHDIKTNYDQKWKQWQWMKYYRVWEANRKVFLYPENWIEPELRDEKSPFFKELENELMQNDITNDTVEQAYLNYLEKLDKVANLEIRAMYNQVISPDETVLHVFGRSRSSMSPEYFYRQRINGGRWLAWEKIDLDINANHLVAGMHNRRLFLLWPQFLEKVVEPTTLPIPKQGDTDSKITPPTKYWEIRLFWSEAKKGKWTPKVLSDSFQVLYQAQTGGNHPENISFRVREKPYINASIFTTRNTVLAQARVSGFNKIGKQIVADENSREYLISGPGGIFHNGLILTNPGSLYFYYNSYEYEKADVKQQTKMEASTLAETSLALIDANGITIEPQPRASTSSFSDLVANTIAEYFEDERPASRQYILEVPTIGIPVWVPGWVPPTLRRPPPGSLPRIYLHKDAESIFLLENLMAPTYTVIDSKARAFSSKGEFFVWDTHRTYFVDYSWDKNKSYTSSGTMQVEVTSSFRFFIHYHPFVELFIKELNIWGIKGLLNRPIQVDPASVSKEPSIFKFSKYQPTNNVTESYELPNGRYSHPVEDVDFSDLGAYSPYNWELFFHVPLFIANKLSTNQRFEEALAWYHYIFDPTSTDTTTTPDPKTPQQKYWITKPFYENTNAVYRKQKIEELLLTIAQGNKKLQAQVKEWRNNPFKPHLIARMRTVAYQKAVLIKYIKTLIAWGDQLFGRDTIETVNEATQLYILAATILGPRPKSIPKKITNPIKTFYQLEQDGIDDFGNALKQVENLLPAVSASSTMGDDSQDLPKLVNVLYFCIPNNTNLLALWDTVADRLFKIRHCMNIEGVVRQLPLFDPPIDPGLLVKATAAGLDIGQVLNEINAPMPLYRFNFMIQKALEICSEVKALGNAMLSALEKNDAEGFALLRSSHEQIMLDQVRFIKNSQIDEALRTKESLDESRKVIVARRDHYQQLINDGWNNWEKAWLNLTIGAMGLETAGVALDFFGTAVSIIPDIDAGVAGVGGSPTIKFKFGGKNIAMSVKGAADALKGLSSIAQMSAGMTSTIGSYARRAEDWDLQKQLADKELPQVDKQIAAADIRHDIAVQDLKNQDKQIENAQKENEYLHTKFTNQELYDWMINQISTVYFQSYQLAYDIAKRAERCFRYELGLSDSSYIQYGYWDSLKKGLLSGEKLFYDLKRLESAYYEQNRREYELTKHISLAQLDPLALLTLRQNGQCIVDIPELAFDMDYPGHYFRRIKSVSLSIPCVAGPYTTIACTLTLTRNSLRKDTTLLKNEYKRNTTIEDTRFRDEIAAIQSIATSHAQNDSGLFELNFRDERYLPFEGAGAISTWQIKMNKAFPQFDFSSITDVVINLNYTAREGGDRLGKNAAEALDNKISDKALSENNKGLFRVYDLKREYSDKWYKFLHPANPGDVQQLVLDDLADRLPYFTKKFTKKNVKRIEIAALMHDDAQNYQVMLSPPLGTTEADYLELNKDNTYQGLHYASKVLAGNEVDLAHWKLQIKADGSANFKSLPVDAISELFLIINYSIE